MQTQELIEYLEKFDKKSKASLIVINPTARKKYSGEVMIITDMNTPVFIYEITKESNLDEDEEQAREKLKHTAMKESSVMYWDMVRSLCISKNLYTRGTAEQYRELEKIIDSWQQSENEVTTEMLQIVAENILEHSETEYEIESLMFEISRSCVNRFYAAAED